ncbi:MAG: glycosyltransferase family 1 protein [Roseiflexaceae bacterium]|nr:glycosyltransferase family 1 protein [Roseiflexaceae bacterium]
MRVALMTETFLPDTNGVVSTLCRLLEHLQANGHEAMLFAPHDAPASYAGAQIIPLAGMPLPMYPDLKFTPPQFGITAQLRRFKPDLLHLAGLVALGPTGRYVADVLNLPLVGAYHTDFPAYSTHYGLGWLKSTAYSYLRWFHNRCGVNLCPSSATIADLRAHGFRRLRLWGRGVDTVRFHPGHRSEAWRRSVGAQPDERVLLYVGRLATEKRVELLVEALRQTENARLVLVGDGPARPGLEHAFRGLPAHFSGFLRGDDLAAAYASADMFVFPSDTETFGQVVQEAMASGLPVVAARAGGVTDLVRDQVTGTFFEPGSSAKLGAQLATLLAMPERYQAMGRAGRAAAELRSWPSVMDELLGHYTRVERRWRRPHLRRRAASL